MYLKLIAGIFITFNQLHSNLKIINENSAWLIDVQISVNAEKNFSYHKVFSYALLNLIHHIKFHIFDTQNIT